MHLRRTTPRRPRTRRRLHVLAAGGLLLLVAGCQREDPAATVGLTRDQFVDVMVELREAELAAEDTTGGPFSARKAEILERYGTSEEEVRAFVDAYSRDIEEMTELWERISVRLRRLHPRDSALLER